MYDSRGKQRYRPSSILLLICMIIFDQTSLSDSLIADRRGSYHGRRRQRSSNTAKRRSLFAGDGDEKHLGRSGERHRLPYQLVRTAATVDRRRLSDLDDMIENDEIKRERTEGNKGHELGQDDTAEVKYNKGPRSDGLRQLDNYVSLDTRGDFELFWDVDSVTETIQFRLVANVDKDDLLAFGFSAYGEPEDADLCVVWTNLHGRHMFQVKTSTWKHKHIPRCSHRLKPA